MQLLNAHLALPVLQFIPCSICLGDPVTDRDVQLRAYRIVGIISFEYLTEHRAVSPREVRWRGGGGTRRYIRARQSSSSVILHGGYEVELG